jgi:limonene-1,2-epoxide hydrolase
MPTPIFSIAIRHNHRTLHRVLAAMPRQAPYPLIFADSDAPPYQAAAGCDIRLSRRRDKQLLCDEPGFRLRMATSIGSLVIDSECQSDGDICMLTNDQIIRRFSAAMTRMDVNELIEYFTPDAVYIMVPMPPPLRGRKEIYDSLAGMPKRFKGVEIETISQIASGNFVVSEFTAHLRLEHQTMVLPMADFFELENGKIKMWREYFNAASFKTLKDG